MATLSDLQQQSPMLQKQAIDKAQSAFSRLPKGDATFQQCVNQADSIPDVLESVTRRHRTYRDKKSTRLLQRFQQYTLFLQNISEVVDVVVQTQAGIGCPVWAPIKFVLQVSKDHAYAAEQVLNLIQALSENHPRFEIYEKLQSNPVLQTSMLNLFTDVVEFSVRAFQFFGRGTLVRLTRLVGRPFKEEFEDIFDRLKRRTEVVDHTAVAIELLRAAESRKYDRKIRCQRWLSPPNVNTFHEIQVQKKLQGTCDWLSANPSFVKWNEPSSLLASDRLLCIYGTHGCGKTVLASSIIEDSRRKQQTLFFYFTGRDASLQDMGGLVRTFLSQMLEDATDEHCLEIVDSLLAKGPPAVHELLSALKRAAALVDRPVYCVIDGIDECVTECDDLASELLKLVLGLLNANTNFRVVLLGRQHVVQPHMLRAAIGETPQMIEINHSLIKQDINSFIDSEIDNKMDAKLLGCPGLRDSIFNTLQEKSDGMFLWVELMTKDLCRSASPFELAERLHNPPSRLEGIYRRLLLRLIRRLDKFQLELARTALAFTVVSCRILDIDELRHAHALACGSGSSFEEHLLLQPVQRILDVCGDFINVKDDLVQLVHFSVKEFLTRPEDEWRCGEDQEIICFRVDLEGSHRSLGSACIDYLRICEYGSPLSDADFFFELGKRYPFLKYASRYTLAHLNQSGSHCSVTLDKFGDFLESDKCAPWIEYLAMIIFEDGSVPMLEDEIIAFEAWLVKGDCKRELFENKLRMSFNRELENRIRTFGEHDPRTAQCQYFLEIIGQFFLKVDGDKEVDRGSAIRSRSSQKMPVDFSTISDIQSTLNGHSTLPLNRQVQVLLKLQSHLMKAAVLTDPLKKLFRIILQKAPSIPVYVLLAVGNFYSRFEKWEEAREVYCAALLKMDDQETPAKCIILGEISYTLWQQNKVQEAEAWCRRTLKAREEVLGREHEDTLATADMLGDVLQEQGEYGEAESLFRHILKLDERMRGKEHKDTLAAAHTLGYVLQEQGEYGEAESLFRQTLESRGRVLGKEHECTLSTAHMLGYVLQEQGEYGEAESLYRQTLESKERVLGKEHQDTLLTKHELVFVLKEQQKYEEAEAFNQETGENKEDSML